MEKFEEKIMKKITKENVKTIAIVILFISLIGTNLGDTKNNTTTCRFYCV